MIHDARLLYRELGLQVEPNWYLIFLLLEQKGRLSVMEIAAALGWKHPSVVMLTSRMQERGLLNASGSPRDRRRRLLSLAPAGRAQLAEIRPVWAASRRGLQQLVEETGVELLPLLDSLEAALVRRGFRLRTLDSLAGLE